MQARSRTSFTRWRYTSRPHHEIVEYGVDMIVEVIGWIGAVMLLVGYGLVSLKRIAGDSAPYQLLNLGGCITMIINSGYHGAWPSAGLNIVWAIVGTAFTWRALAKGDAA